MKKDLNYYEHNLLIPLWRNSIVAYKLIIFIIKLQNNLCYKFWYSSLFSIIGIVYELAVSFEALTEIFRRNENFKR